MKERKKQIIISMFFVILLTAIVYLKTMPNSLATINFKENVTYIDENNDDEINRGDTVKITVSEGNIYALSETAFTTEDFTVLKVDDENGKIYLFPKHNLDIMGIYQNTICDYDAIENGTYDAAKCEALYINYCNEDPTDESAGYIEYDDSVYHVLGAVNQTYKFKIAKSLGISDHTTVSVKPAKFEELVDTDVDEPDEFECNSSYWLSDSEGNYLVSYVEPRIEGGNYRCGVSSQQSCTTETATAEKSGVRPIIILNIKDLYEGEYTVTFDIGSHGTNPEPQKVISGETATEPEEQEVSCYNFSGWYSDPEMTQPFSFDTSITSDITLYGSWTAGSYTLSFEMNGHGSQVPSQTLGCGDDIVIPNDPEEDEWVFEGWFSDEDLTIPFPFDPISEDTVAYAKWEHEPITVTFILDDHTDVTPDPQEIPYGESASEPTMDQQGCEYFDAWYVDPEHTQLFDFTTELTAHTEIYGTWTTRTVTLSFDLNGHPGSIDSQVIACGETTTRPTDPTDDGYEFIGWNGPDGSEFPFGPITEDTIVTAEWEQVYHTVRYDNNGHGNDVQEEQVPHGDMANEPSMSDDGCWIFEGWYLDDPDTLYDFNSPIVGDIVLHAKWSIKSVTLSFDLNGHPGSISSQTISCGGTTTRPEDPTDEGYDFIGWNGPDGSEFPFGPIEEDTTVTAEWDKKPYTVTFEIGSHGTNPNPQTVEYLDPAEEPTVSDEECWEFEGWYTEPELVNSYNFSDGVTEDITLYGKWVKKIFTLTFNMNRHGSQIAAIEVECGNPAYKPTDPEETGYNFIKWEDPATNEEYDFNTPLYADKTINAIWEIVPVVVTFDIGAHGENPTPQEIEINGQATDPNISGDNCWIFEGWYLDPEFTTAYDFNNPVVQDTKLYGKWTQKTFKLYFDLGGHGTEMAYQEVGCGEKATKPTDPTDPTYNFVNWYVEEGKENIFDFTYEFNEDKTIYADWKIKTVVVHFDNKDHGEQPEDVEIEINTLIPKPTDLSEDDYSFEGWYSDPELTIEWNFDEDTPSENITLYAKWESTAVSPQTYDAIVLYALIGGLSLTGIVGIIFYKKKHNM